MNRTIQKALVIGCGSMGKRRIRDLAAAGVEVIAADDRQDRRDEVSAHFGVAVYSSAEAALQHGPDAMVVSVPPALHASFIKVALRAGIHVFSEAPLCLTLEELFDIKKLAQASSRLVGPSCTWLHHPYHVQLKQSLTSGEYGPVLCFDSHFGAHLGTWHPREGLDFYAIDRRNGGMGFDILVHQFQLLQSLAGPPRSVHCLAAKRSSLPAVSGYDMYDVLLQFPLSSAAIHCDVIQRPPQTRWSAWGEWGTVEWTWGDMEVRFAAGEVRTIPLPAGFTFEEVYRAEIDHFLAAAAGHVPYMHPLDSEEIVLRALFAAEDSATKGVSLALGA